MYFFKLMRTILMTDLSHKVGQLVHGVGETLGLPLHRSVPPSLVTTEPESGEDCAHHSAAQWAHCGNCNIRIGTIIVIV